MISKQELNPKKYVLTSEQEKNQQQLLIAINVVRTQYAKTMVVTSGVRSNADQKIINPKAPKSKHIIGAAVDILDRDGSLNTWCKVNEAILEKAGLWCEERQGPWQHFQCLPPASKKRWFFP